MGCNVDFDKCIYYLFLFKNSFFFFNNNRLFPERNIAWCFFSPMHVIVTRVFLFTWRKHWKFSEIGLQRHEIIQFPTFFSRVTCYNIQQKNEDKVSHISEKYITVSKFMNLCPTSIIVRTLRNEIIIIENIIQGVHYNIAA